MFTEEIVRGKELLQTVIDSGPDWIYAIDRECRILLMNQNMAVALGHSDLSQLIGRFDCELFPQPSCFMKPSDHSCEFHKDERDVLKGKTVFHAREQLILPNGKRLFFETYKTPLKDSSGNLYGILCYRRDISQRLQLEKERQSLEKELWQAKKMEAVGQLAGGIAHDFNHMLSLILGYAQFARTTLSSGKTEKLDSYLSEIVSAGTSGQAVVAQLLAFSRSDETADAAIDIAGSISETVESLRSALIDQCSLDLQIETALPQVLIKPVQARQIVTNLVFNARDASPPGERIAISCQRETVSTALICSSCHHDFDGDFVCLSVTDNGSGISSTVIERIFDPFYTTKDLGQGSGLGLPMIHGIVHSAGGHIQCISDTRPGTSLRIFLPTYS